MSSLFSVLSVLIEHPWIAGLVGAGFYVLGRVRGRRVARVVGLVWLVYLVYEYGMKLRVLCSGECNIRLDLLLLYPLLVALSLVAVVVLLRQRRP